MQKLCRGCSSSCVDRILIDKLLVGGRTVRSTLGRLLRWCRWGCAALPGHFRHRAGRAGLRDGPSRRTFEVKVRIEGRSATVDLARRRAAADKLDYGFDFDGDGLEDRAGAAASANWLYPQPGHYHLRVRIKDPRWNTSRTIERTIDIQ